MNILFGVIHWLLLHFFPSKENKGKDRTINAVQISAINANQFRTLPMHAHNYVERLLWYLPRCLKLPVQLHDPGLEAEHGHANIPVLLVRMLQLVCSRKQSMCVIREWKRANTELEIITKNPTLQLITVLHGRRQWGVWGGLKHLQIFGNLNLV